MLVHLSQVVTVCEEMFHFARLLFTFDWSSNHSAMPCDALNADAIHVNVNDVGIRFPLLLASNPSKLANNKSELSFY